MFDTLFDILRSLYEWTQHWANTPYGPFALFALAFAESSFFPIPPDILLIALSLAEPKYSFLFAGLCTIGSVIGGMFGYFLGIKGGKPLLEKMFKKEKVEIAHNLYQRYANWAVVIAAFTPVPYKIFTILTGTLYADFKKFVLISIIGRGARFFLIGTLIFIFGEPIREFIGTYFNLVTVIFCLLLIAGFIIIYVIPKRKWT